MAVWISNPLLRWGLGLEPEDEQRVAASLRRLATPFAVYLIAAGLLLMFQDAEQVRVFTPGGWGAWSDVALNIAIGPGFACALVTSLIVCCRRKQACAIWSAREELIMAGVSRQQLMVAMIPLQAYGFAGVGIIHSLLIGSAARGYQWVVPFPATAIYMLAPIVSGLLALAMNSGLAPTAGAVPRFLLSLGIGFLLEPTAWLFFVIMGIPAGFRMVENTGYSLGAITAATWVARLWLVRLLLTRRLESIVPS